jgi:hypothetical protein
MAKRARHTGKQPVDAVTAEIKAAARAAGSEAIAALRRLASSAQSESVQLAAIKELLDRGFGRSAPAPSDNAGGTTAHVMVDDGYAN